MDRLLSPAAWAAVLGPGDAGGLATKNEVMACWLRSEALLARMTLPFFAGAGLAGPLPVAEVFRFLLTALGVEGSALLAVLFEPVSQHCK